MPILPSSTFIRSYFSIGNQFPFAAFDAVIKSEQLVEPIEDAVGAYRTNQLHGYLDLIDRSR